MIVLKSKYRIDEKKLNKDESKYFISNLIVELRRHENDARECRVLEMKVEKPVSIKFWQTEREGHLNDVKSIRKTIEYLKKKHNLDIWW